VLKDPACQLKWVLRQSECDAGRYASRLLGHAVDAGPIYAASRAACQDWWRRPEHQVDVVIDFSDASSVALYPYAASGGIRIVSAISNYSPEHLQVVDETARKTALLHSANITVGINFLMVAAKVLRDFAPHADIDIVEEHFRSKVGVSGTAMRIAGMLGIDGRQIKSLRAGGIIGRHEVIFGMPNQTLRMTHESISRAAFGRGALVAAKWLYRQAPGRYSMEEIVRESVTRSLHVA